MAMPAIAGEIKIGAPGSTDKAVTVNVPGESSTAINFYASIRSQVGYYKANSDYTGVPAGPAQDWTIQPANMTSDAGTNLNLSGQARFGARMTTSNNLRGHVEFGFQEAARTNTSYETNLVYSRMLYGAWDFGKNQSLVVGKDYTPATYTWATGMFGDIGDNSDGVFTVAGIPYIGRQPQIKLILGKFQVAAIEANKNTNNTISSPGLDNIDYIIPRLEATYVYEKPNLFKIQPVAGFQTYKLKNTSNGLGADVTSYLLGMVARWSPGNAYFNLAGSYHQNATNYGQANYALVNQYSITTTAAQWVNNAIQNSNMYMGIFVAGYKFSPKFTMEAGVSLAKADVVSSPGVKAEQQGMVCYLQAPITITKGFMIIPEIGMIDRGDLHRTGQADAKLGNMQYVATSFRFDL